MNNVILDCQTVTSICDSCVTGYQCNSCYNVPISFPYTYGGSCFCDSDQYYSSETCIGKSLFGRGFLIKLACSTLDSNCVKCSDASTCKACSGSLLIYGNSCVTTCPSGSYDNKSGVCACKTNYLFV